MKRRDLLMLAACEANVPPIDEGRMNAFAAAYNEYAARLKDGVLDIKAWDRVVTAWRRLQ